MPFLAKEHTPIPSQDLLSWMFDNPKYDIDEPIYIDTANPSRTISARQAKTLTRKLAAGFKKAGLKKGDCVCIHSFNDIFYSMLFLGIIASGGIFAGTNPSYTSYELSHSIQTAHIRFMIIEPDNLTTALEAASKTNIPRENIFVFDHHHDGDDAINEQRQKKWKAMGLRSWKWLLEHGEEDWERFDDENRSKKESVARLFSSGTTGLPKALDMTHMNFVAQHTLVMEYKDKDYEVSRLLCNPMFHVSIVPRAHTSPLRGGYPTYIMRRFTLEAWLANVEKHQVTEVNTVPPMVHQVLTNPHLTSKYSLKSVRNAWCGAAPLSADSQKRFKALLREDAPFNQLWGMSETSCIATMLHWPHHSIGDVGRFLPNLDAKLVDDDGNDISAYNTRGEIACRGPTIINGYFENEKANRDSFDDDGYFKTGDIGYVDKETGLWYIVDRKKDLIKVRGFQVSPAELEGVLHQHSGIRDAAVIGVSRPAYLPSAQTPSDPRYEERKSEKKNDAEQGDSEYPRAYVVPQEEGSVNEISIMKWIEEKLAKYKKLDGGIVILKGNQAIPKNASGKILKVQLKEQAKKEMRAGEAKL